MKDELSRHGHVSAEQLHHLAGPEFSYTTKYVVPFFNLTQQEWQHAGQGAFCAGMGKRYLGHSEWVQARRAQ